MNRQEYFVTEFNQGTPEDKLELGLHGQAKLPLLYYE